MVEVRTYHLSPTPLIPNSPYPLIHYKGLLPPDTKNLPTKFYDLIVQNGWQCQWIFQYGKTQKSHYHSYAHECMLVLSGTATIRFGVADTSDDLNKNTWGSEKEEGGIELQACPGDVFIIPMGVAHKTYDAKPESAKTTLLTPGTGHGLPPDIRDRLEDIELDGFTMMGAYPKGGEWDFAVGGEGAATYARVWSSPPAPLDPVLGDTKEGICGTWKNASLRLGPLKSSL